MKKILLNRAHGQDSVNVENSIPIELSTKQCLLNGGYAAGTINQYEVYLNERNSTRKYKMVFTVNPYMTNILFNMFTEIVYDEGSNNSFILGDNILNKNGEWNNAVRIFSDNSGLTRYGAIKDTEYSHPYLGNFSYYCGVDIFNNHIFRGNGYFAIKKGQGKINNSKFTNGYVFNTIEDYIVYGDGQIATHKREIPGSEHGPTSSTEEKVSHMYNHSNITSFQTTFMTKLKEENGWLGFYNRAYANEKNHTIYKDGEVHDITINKIINNRNACDFIDMYPDRSLFSLLPKINEKYNNREEYNWDWRITYPYRKRYFNVNELGIEQPDRPYDFFEKDKGLKVVWHTTENLQIKGSNSNLLEDKFVTCPSCKTSIKILGKDNVECPECKMSFVVNDEKTISYDYLITRENRVVYFRTKAKHGLKMGDIIRFKADNKADFSCKVMGIGDMNGNMGKYYFSVSYDDLADGWGEETRYLIGSSMMCVRIPSNIYVAKIVNGIPCDYYIRDFKSISKLKSSINKAGFAKTIYGDPVAQIIYSDDIDTTGLVDHMGRELTEIYLTLVKNNRGYDKWYKSGVTNPSYVEFSHCFGEITSGFDFEVGENEHMDYDVFKNYNVRMLYNTFETTATFPGHETMGIPYAPPTSLEGGIVAGDGYDNVFCGDFVEFSPSTVEETVLEVVYHRFNTAQRETLNSSVSGSAKNVFPMSLKSIQYDEIVFDDNDFGDNLEKEGATKNSIVNFTVESRSGIRNSESDAVKFDGFVPEGYFYKAHHRVKLREFSNNISKDYDTQIPVITLSNGEKIQQYRDGMQYEMTTSIPYHVSNGDKILLLYQDKTYKECIVSNDSVGEKIVFRCDALNDFNPWRVYLKNPSIPEHAYYFADGTGKHMWREIIPDTELTQDSDIYDRAFANGAIYINNNISLYLRRQDPDGRYGLQYTYERVKDYANFTLSGLKKDMPDIEYKVTDNNATCEL